MSIALAWCDFKTYCEEIGPGRRQPPRPAQCVFCDGLRVWFNGWRRVLPTLLVDGRPYRPAEWVALRRVRCARRECGRGLHVSVYTHYLKVFHLSAAQALHRKDAPR